MYSLPHDRFIWRHFEETPSGAFTNQGVPIREAFGTAHYGTVEGKRWLPTILPDDQVGCRVDLDDAGVWHALSTPVRSIVEEQHASGRQIGRIVLVREVPRPPLPAKVPGAPVDNAHHADLTEAHYPVPRRCYIDGVTVCPLAAGLEGTDAIVFQTEVLPGAPLGHDGTVRGDLLQHIAQHRPRVLLGLVATTDLRVDVCRQRCPQQHQRIAVGEPLEVEMQH